LPAVVIRLDIRCTQNKLHGSTAGIYFCVFCSGFFLTYHVPYFNKLQYWNQGIWPEPHYRMSNAEKILGLR